MRYKLNMGKRYKDSTMEKSNIFLKYRDEVSHLLTPTTDSYRKYSYDALYVETGLSNDIRSFVSDKNDVLVYLTGLTGSGKTSLLKHVFKHYENPVVLEGDTLVISFSCNSMMGNIDDLKKRLSTLFLSVCEILCDKYAISRYNVDINNFYDYIKKQKGQFAVNQKGWKPCPAEEILNQVYADGPLEFALFALKYSLAQTESLVTHLVFIMDDVEAVGVNNEIFPMYLANKVMSCLKHRSMNEKDKWGCTVFVACRHYVFRIFKTRLRTKDEEDIFLKDADIDKSTMESFSAEDIDMRQGPSIKEIILKRKNEIIKGMENTAEIDDFNEICEFILSIVDQAGELLLVLNLYDYRRTFSCLKKVVFNKRWLQRFESSNGAFKIGSAKENYITKMPNIIRAIAMGENDFYFGEYSIIPNLLQNKQDSNDDLWILLLLSRFIKNGQEFNWSNSEDLGEVKKQLSMIFGDDGDYSAAYKEALNFLLVNRLLLRGKREQQQDSADLVSIDIDNVRFVYLSVAAKTLWDNLYYGSSLFELFVDDIWIENPVRLEVEKNKKFVQFSVPNFRECINYLRFLIDVEMQIRRYALNRGRQSKYVAMFGKQPVTNQLYYGLHNSFLAYYTGKIDIDELEIIKTNRIREQLKEVQRKIDKCKDMFCK